MPTRPTSRTVQSHLLSFAKIDRVWLLIGIGVVIRLVFIGWLNLLPEEAYYWNYAAHLNIGYLDHPPMVAWLIYAFQLVLGRSEFAVRLPAFLGWIAIAFFMYRLTVDIAGKHVGKLTVLLLACLPIYMSVGFIMTPDAPFYVAWAGALYFVHQAVVHNRKNAWYLVGLFLGLGLLSKYTMGLVVVSTVVYLLIDKRSRHWFVKPQPYIALLIGAVLFSPVIYWNAEHGWMSFVFQGSRRWSHGLHIQTHALIGAALILITPLGVYEAVVALWSFWKQRRRAREDDPTTYRKYLFCAVFVLAPLAVFLVFSLQGVPKLNWTGPVWFAALPLISARIIGARSPVSLVSPRPMARRWLRMVVVLFVLYAGGFGYLVAGMPGFNKGTGMKLPVAWSAMGDRVEKIESAVESESHTEPLIVGLDKYWLASEIGFYDREDEDSLPEVAGQNLMGAYALMWDYWMVPKSANGRTVLVVSFTEDKLSEDWVTHHFSHMGEPKTEILRNRFGEIGRFSWRVGYDYRADDTDLFSGSSKVGHDRKL